MIVKQGMTDKPPEQMPTDGSRTCQQGANLCGTSQQSSNPKNTFRDLDLDLDLDLDADADADLVQRCRDAAIRLPTIVVLRRLVLRLPLLPFYNVQ